MTQAERLDLIERIATLWAEAKRNSMYSFGWNCEKLHKDINRKEAELKAAYVELPGEGGV